MAEYDILINRAREARKHAYAPYSKFFVGVCIKTKDGNYFTGTNIENASYGLTICAERTAIFQVYSKGYRKKDIEAIAIAGPKNRLLSPCGACRQVLLELLEKNNPIILLEGNNFIVTNIQELMPLAFTKDVLEGGEMK